MTQQKYTALTPDRFRKSPYWDLIREDDRRVFDVTTQVLPFRVNDFVLENLIDWDTYEDDPMYRLLFPQKGMLSDAQFRKVDLALQANSAALRAAVYDVRRALNPHPAGQLTKNIQTFENNLLEGVQHKYTETILFFPSAGQTCHAYCSFCFRWPQFVGEPEWKIQARETEQVVSYLKEHPHVTDVLITGGDPMIMNTKILQRYIEAFLKIDTVRAIRIGTKALSYWPARFLDDDDGLMELFEKVIASGKHLAIMAHINHWRELEPPMVRQAIQRVRNSGASIRTQAPLLANINDDATVWERLWGTSVSLGMMPYYMFLERDTGPSNYFRVPLVKAWEVYSDAYRAVSGLARTARGPVMSTDVGKVCVDGVLAMGNSKALSLRLLQARDAGHVGQPFLAEYDERAAWLNELQPYQGDAFFFEGDGKTSRTALIRQGESALVS